MGASEIARGAQFEDVTLSNATPISLVSTTKDTEPANDIERRKSMGMTKRECLSVFILVLVNLLNYMDRFTIAGVLTDIQRHFQIDDAMAGLLQTVFIVAFMLVAPICGYLADRFNRKNIMIVGLLIWVSAVLGSTFIPSGNFWAFILLRGIVGVGEASYSTVGPTIIADMFANVLRSRILMLYYFAIPVGSGLGFIVGGKVAAWAGAWQWGVRTTPPFGILCVLGIIFLINEPERGKAEADQGAENVKNQVASSYFQDLFYLMKNKTYVFSTIGYTFVVFVTGTLSWWTATAIEYAKANQQNLTSIDMLDPGEKSNISLVFGILMLLGGIIGVTSGTLVAQFWKRGQLCFKGNHNSRADALVCMIGSIVACPFLFIGMHLIEIKLWIAWISMFVAITFLCLNWAINVDMLLYIVLPNKRSLATGMQILISHLFGDASGPYLIGLISDLIRGKDHTPIAHFDALVYAFYFPSFLLILSAISFGVAAYTLVADKEKFDIAMGYKQRTVKVTMGKGLDNASFEINKNV